MNWARNGTILFCPAFSGPVGAKINIKFQLQSQFQRFLSQTVCVFSQMNNIKHIRRGFHLVAWVMPQGWDFGLLGGWGLVKN